MASKASDEIFLFSEIIPRVAVGHAVADYMPEKKIWGRFASAQIGLGTITPCQQKAHGLRHNSPRCMGPVPHAPR